MVETSRGVSHFFVTSSPALCWCGHHVTTKKEHWSMIVELEGDRAWRQSQRDALVPSDCGETKKLLDSELAHPSCHSFEPLGR